MSFVYPGSAWPTRSWPERYWPLAGTVPPEPEPTLLPDVGWVNGLYTLILVGNPQGVVIGELAADIDSVASLLNDVGQARLTVANPGTAAELMELGNRILMFFDNGMPTWAGFIDPPRRWRYDSVDLTAYGGERLPAQRVTQRTRRFAAATPGAMFAALLAEQASPAVVDVGQVYVGGEAVAEEFHLENLLKVIQDKLLGYGGDYNVTGSLEGGRIRLRANFYARRGRYLPDCWLLEGHNAVNVEPEEQGPIINEWLTAGAGNGWEARSRPYATARDATSVTRFGLRQASEVMSGVSDAATLAARTGLNLGLSAWPYVATPFDALNLPPARFGDYDVGDEVNVELYSMMDGFRGVRRVIGREFRPRDGVCGLVVA